MPREFRIRDYRKNIYEEVKTGYRTREVMREIQIGDVYENRDGKKYIVRLVHDLEDGGRIIVSRSI